jgi:MFS family permease
MSPRLAGALRIVLHIYVPSVLMGFGLGMLYPTLPAVAHAFGVAPEVAAQGVTALLIGRAAILFPAGYVVDRFGRRAAMMAGPLIVVAGLLLTATTPWFVLVLVGQALVGGGEGLWSLGREIAAMEQIRAEQRGRVIGAFFGISAAGTTIGPVVGGRLTDWAGYPAVFMVAGLCALVVCGIGTSYRDGPRRIRRPGAKKAAFRPFDAIAPGYLVTFQVVMFATFCAMLRSTTVQSLLPVYVVSDLGYSASDVGYLFGITGFIQLLMIVPTGFISDKIGRKAAVVPAALLAAVAFAGYALSTDWLGLVLSSAALGICSGLAIGSMTSFTYDLVTPDARGSVQAFRRSVGELGSFTGPMLGGVVAGLSHAGMAFALFAPLHLASALLVGLVARETLNRVPPPEPRPVGRAPGESVPVREAAR